MARKKKDPNAPPGRLSQIRQAYRITKKSQPLIWLILLGTFLVVLAVFIGIGLLLRQPGHVRDHRGRVRLPRDIVRASAAGPRRRRSLRSQSSRAQSLAVLGTLRRGWIVTKEPVAFNRNQDLVFRVVGRCGVVLVGEGAPTRIGHLMAAEKRKTQRVIGDAPLHEVVVGNDPGQVPLRKLSRHIMKLPRPLKPGDVTDLNNRMRAINAMNQPIPMPKGPLPKGVKLPKVPKSEPLPVVIVPRHG